MLEVALEKARCSNVEFAIKPSLVIEIYVTFVRMCYYLQVESGGGCFFIPTKEAAVAFGLQQFTIRTLRRWAERDGYITREGRFGFRFNPFSRETPNDSH